MFEIKRFLIIISLFFLLILVVGCSFDLNKINLQDSKPNNILKKEAAKQEAFLTSVAQIRSIGLLLPKTIDSNMNYNGVYINVKEDEIWQKILQNTYRTIIPPEKNINSIFNSIIVVFKNDKVASLKFIKDRKLLYDEVNDNYYTLNDDIIKLIEQKFNKPEFAPINCSVYYGIPYFTVGATVIANPDMMVKAEEYGFFYEKSDQKPFRKLYFLQDKKGLEKGTYSYTIKHSVVDEFKTSL